MQISSSILCGIYLFTLTAISVDRLLALLLGLRYRQVVTVKRVRGIVILSWLVFTSFGMLYFWNIDIFIITTCVNVLLCLTTSTCCYMKICFTLRYRQAQVLQKPRPGQMFNCTRAHVLRYKKTVYSSLWVYFTLINSVLSSVRCSSTGRNYTRSRESVLCYRRRKHHVSGLSQFLAEPSYLLLEDQRS